MTFCSHLISFADFEHTDGIRADFHHMKTGDWAETPMTKCFVQKNYPKIDNNIDVCNGLSATVCKKKIGKHTKYRISDKLVFSDDGYGNFQLIADKQLEVDIETSGRDSQDESDTSIEVTFPLGSLLLN